MRYIHFIIAFVAFIVSTACTTSNVDDVTVNTSGANRQLQVVGRITQFSDCDVATRSKKDGDEPKVTSMGLALFPIDGNTIGDCVYYDYEEGSNIVFIVERGDEVFNQYTDKQFAMYIFANMQGTDGFPTADDDGKGMSFADFTACAVSATTNVADVPENGFPMVGSIGNNTNSIDADGIEFILKPTASSDNVDGLPKINGVPTDNLEISMKALYAKFSFTIAVKPDQEIVGNKAPRFDLLSYEVHNIASTVDSDSSTNDDAAVVETSGEVSQNSYAQGATTTTFNFYLPERYLTPAQSINDVLPDELKKGTYDQVVDADQNGYRDQDERYHQRFKNLLPGTDQKATYVTINGKFTDHQGHTYDVAYNIYLGGNNYDDFNIIRNTHYDNSVTIRGISSSSDQATNEDAVSIDWRVNVERSTPLVINLRRESLLDAHYEVRPLRLRLVGENIPTGTSATVTILNEDGTTNNLPGWIRLEKSGTGSDYIASGVSAGKRKYFTVDLVTNTLQDGTSITLDNLTADNQTLWIYVDENTDTKSRTAIVRVSHQGVDTDFKIVQNGLYEVKSPDGARTYYIEQYEEYLYNYDAEDDYGQTKDEGMVWGLNGVQLSKEHNSFYIDEDNEEWNNYVENTSLLKYDFYIGKYDGFVSDGVMVHGYAGQHFTNEIFENSNGAVKSLTMAEQPSGAVEYCYNRNKRNADGSIAAVEWYLPSADELEDFIVTAYASFKEFQDNYYWTSQPAYIRNAFYYEYATGGSRGSSVRDAYAFTAYEDNKEYARATKVVAKGNDVFDYALSGLNKIPTDAHAMDDNCISQNAQLLDGSYFNVMYSWYRWNGGTTTITFTEDEHFNAKKDGNSTGVRYHIHVGHSFDTMYQVDENGDHGYHPRTKKNRVRCVRRDWNPNNNYEAEIVYTVSTTPATELDISGGTMYVMRNTNYSSTQLTTSGTNLAASNATVGSDNYVTIEGNKIKSVAKGQYFNGYNGNVSFSDSATSYDITKNGDAFTISYSTTTWFNTTTYYLKQTSNTAVSMSSGNNGNNNWYFYEVTKEYK